MTTKDRKGFFMVFGIDGWDKFLYESEIPDYKKYLKGQFGGRRFHSRFVPLNKNDEE